MSNKIPPNIYLDINTNVNNFLYSSTKRLEGTESIQQSQQRSTPCKFTIDHSVASLSNGVMVCVKPQFSPNDFSKIVKVFNMGKVIVSE